LLLVILDTDIMLQNIILSRLYNANNLSFSGATKINIFYFSDYHAVIPAYRHLKTASDTFDKKHEDSENLKLSAGDVFSGTELKKRDLVSKILKSMNFDACAIGNHDRGRNFNFYEYLKNNHLTNQKNKAEGKESEFFTDFMACNTETPNDKEYNKLGLFKSKIVTKNGEKFGLIGVTTPDYKTNYCKLHNISLIKNDIEQEIQKLKEQEPELDKIILLSHLGTKEERKIAKIVSDIDIIIGGHSHDNEYELFESPKKEPVLIVQEGNEKTFGELTVEFDENGRIDLSKGNSPKNKVDKVFNYSASEDIKRLEKDTLGETYPVGTLVREFSSKRAVKKENPILNIMTDAILNKTGADLALVNPGSVRSLMEAGKITARDVEYCFPMPHPVVTVKYTKQQLADVIREGVESTKLRKIKPGIMHVSGARYTVTADKKVKDFYTVDENGNKKIEIIDSKGNIVSVENPEKPTLLTVAVSEYVISNPQNMFNSLKKIKIEDDKETIDRSQIISSFDTERNILIDYFQSNFMKKNKEIDVDTNRITLESKI